MNRSVLYNLCFKSHVYKKEPNLTRRFKKRYASIGAGSCFNKAIF